MSNQTIFSILKSYHFNYLKLTCFIQKCCRSSMPKNRQYGYKKISLQLNFKYKFVI